MKKFLPVTGGHDFRLDDLMVIEQAYQEAMAGIVSALAPSGSCILSGCQPASTITALGTIFASGWVAMKLAGQPTEVFYFAGGLVPFTTISMGGSTPALYFKVQSSVITPSSPVPYEDTTNHNVHFDRTVILKNSFGITSGDNSGVDGMYFSDLSYAGAVQKGTVIEWYPSFAFEENTLFDASGYGHGRLTGYAVCNGFAVFPGSTRTVPDLRGQFTIQPAYGVGMTTTPIIAGVIDHVGYDPTTGAPTGATLTLGQRVGNSTVSILQNNFPICFMPLSGFNHTHPLPDLTHSHHVVARKYGIPSSLGGSLDYDFYTVALGDSANPYGNYDGAIHKSPADPSAYIVANDNARFTATESTSPIGGPDLPHYQAPNSNTHAGDPRDIKGEDVAGVSPYADSPGLYDGYTTVHEGDKANQGFVRLWNGAGFNTGTPTAWAPTVGSGGAGIPIFTPSKSFAMMKLVRIV